MGIETVFVVIKMTEKEARKWMELKSSDPCPKGYPEKWHQSLGYLEGLAQGRKEVEGIFRTGSRLAHQLHEKAKKQDHIITATEIEFRKELAKYEEIK